MKRDMRMWNWCYGACRPAWKGSIWLGCSSGAAFSILCWGVSSLLVLEPVPIEMEFSMAQGSLDGNLPLCSCAGESHKWVAEAGKGWETTATPISGV